MAGKGMWVYLVSSWVQAGMLGWMSQFDKGFSDFGGCSAPSPPPQSFILLFLLLSVSSPLSSILNLMVFPSHYGQFANPPWFGLGGAGPRAGSGEMRRVGGSQQ